MVQGDSAGGQKLLCRMWLVPGAMVLEQQGAGAAAHEAVTLQNRMLGLFIKGATQHTIHLSYWT